MDDNFGLSAEEFRIQAVYSDETRQFRSPAEPTAEDWVNVRLCFLGMFSIYTGSLRRYGCI